MNEMQWILLAFAVVVVVAIYFVSQKRSSRQVKSRERAPRNKSSRSLDIKKQWAKVDFGASDTDSSSGMKPNADSSETQQAPMTPSIKSTHEAPTNNKIINNPANEDDAFNYMQEKLQLEEEIERQQDHAATSYAAQLTPEQTAAQQTRHKVIEIDDMFPADESYYSPEARDGRHQYNETASQLEVPLDNREPETFAILVLSIADEFSIKAIDQVLKTNGLIYNAEAGIFVKKVNNKTVLRVANIFEPGIFPAEWEEGASTAGIAIILQLPTHIKAPRAMDELILTARRVSQSLRGRMYDMERRMIRETDLQAMRERALDYETTRI
ncbi:cell division protein ZipA [Thiomicrospira cyclica]|uniref:Cell division protein ZipA n=1 Tax=Thiomicrospira cyclica (strain DSM 14477 / JCM 11371 / ALM1) TaxID=717773 RepID=F6DCB7_THICA|nr:cell division protein ZipA C-terminal FtsZ-binding domain-containing protein [Thiomicrospira cyclica]AEG31503.1 ZipA FtsZ-binding region protein [Thiomicrospira cyclica ALM1]